MTFYTPSSLSNTNANVDELEDKKKYKKSLSTNSFTNSKFYTNDNLSSADSPNSFNNKVSADILVDNLLHAYEEK